MPSDNNDYFFHECLKLFAPNGYFGVPHYTKTPYYRFNYNHVVKINENGQFFNFLIPLHQFGTLDQKRVDYYREMISRKAMPTAFSLSVLDVIKPAVCSVGKEFPSIKTHWCLANYLMDGHHKIHAAALEGSECQILSFLSRSASVANESELDGLVKILGSV